MQEEKFERIQSQPINEETPLRALADPITPNDMFYVRNHFDIPKIDPMTWRLTVGGTVRNPLELSLSDIKGYHAISETVTLECAGNGRIGLTPLPRGTPWGYGAVGTATFTGTPLARLLNEAELESETSEVLFTGADAGEVSPGRQEAFARSLALDEARRPDVILAWEINGEPLPPAHGFPVRLIVPRWYGVASVKWLVGVSALEGKFRGYFQTEQYVYRDHPILPDERPLSLMNVQSVIATPTDGARVPLRPVRIAGTAWSGSSQVAKVEISADGGRSWELCNLGSALSPTSATPWQYVWDPSGRGEYTLMVRATDAAGNSQPTVPFWNSLGYGNNSVRSIRLAII